MAQERYITRAAVPRLTGAVNQDLRLMNEFLVRMVAELENRLEVAEKKLRALEKKTKE